MSDTSPDLQRGAYSIKTFGHWASIGRTKIHQEIASGRLSAVRVGRQLLIPADAAERWLASRPPARG